MLFVLGLALLIIATPLGLYKEQEITYSSYSVGVLGNVKLPSGVKDVYPFQPLAVLLVFVGFILIASCTYLAWEDNSTNKETNEEISFGQKEMFGFGVKI